MKFQRGQGLLDLLIGIALSLVLTLALIQLFSITNSSVTVTSAISNMIDDANVAIVAIKNVAIYAGKKSPWIANYRGCYNSGLVGGTLLFSGTGGPGMNNVTQISSCVTAIYSSYLTGGYTIFNSDFGLVGTGSAWNCATNYTNYTGHQNTYKFGYTGDNSCVNFGIASANAIYQMVGMDYKFLQAWWGLSTIGPFSGSSGSYASAPPTSASLSINFQGQSIVSNMPPITVDTLYDCTGAAVDHTGLAVNTFSVDNNNNLNCNSTIYKFWSCTASNKIYPYLCNQGQSSNSRQIIPNVYVMEVLYATGLKQPMGQWGATGAPTGYVDPSNFTASMYIGHSYWQFMQFYNYGIQVGLLLQSVDNVTPLLNNNVYTLITGTQYKNFNDHRLRRVVTITLKTNECIPENLPGCAGADFVGQYFDGGSWDQTGGKIHQGEKIVYRSDNWGIACPTYPYLAQYACYMDLSGNTFAAFACNGTWTYDGGWNTTIGFYPFNGPTTGYSQAGNGTGWARCQLGAN